MRDRCGGPGRDTNIIRLSNFTLLFFINHEARVVRDNRSRRNKLNYAEFIWRHNTHRKERCSVSELFEDGLVINEYPFTSRILKILA